MTNKGWKRTVINYLKKLTKRSTDNVLAKRLLLDLQTYDNLGNNEYFNMLINGGK